MTDIGSWARIPQAARGNACRGCRYQEKDLTQVDRKTVRRRPEPANPKRPWLGAVASIVAIALAIVAAGWWLRPARPGAIILVSIDTLRADRLPLYGYTKGRTPVLDALSRESVVFDSAYSHAPLTLPSHSSMFTGELPFEHGVRDNLGFTLSTDHTTLATRLTTAGYATGGFVSAYVLRAETGVGTGFQVYDDQLPKSGGTRAVGLIQRPGEMTLAAATAWMDRLADDRFFLFLHLYEPHMPYAPPERFSDLDPYDGEIAYADEVAGHLFDYLRRRGWYDAATIIVTGDHGEGLGTHGELEHGLFVYSESIRVPWITRLPGGRAGGRRVAEPIGHVDLLPTLLSLASVSQPEGLRGRNLMPVLTGTGAIAPQGIYSEGLYSRYHFGWSELLALTDGRYRFIRAPREELYDLERDPGETHNIVAERTQTATVMRSALDRLVEGRALHAPSTVSTEDRERLAALGYVGAPSSPVAGVRSSSLPDPKDMVPVLRKYREAIDLVGRREFAAAATMLGTLLDDQPDMTDAWMQYADALTQLGRDADALKALREVVRLKPDDPQALLGAGSALIRLGRLDEARSHARLAAKRAPAEAHEMLADIAITRGQFDEAVREAGLAAEADPGLPLPGYVRGRIAYEQGRYRDALPLFQQAHDAWAGRTVQTANLGYYLADTLARLERYEEAERYFFAELAVYPNNLRAHSGLAMLYQVTSRPALAERTIDQMLVASPSPQAYQAADQLWTAFGRPDRAAAVRAAADTRFGRRR